MRSLAERARTGLELGARGLTLALLGWLWLTSLLPDAARDATRLAGADLATALPGWTLGRAPTAVQVTFDSLPHATEREWLAAVAAAGTRTRWTASRSTPAALALASRADPAGGVDISAAIAAPTRLTLRDQLGPRDSLPAGGTVVRWHLGSTPAGPMEVTGSGVRAAAEVPDSLHLRRLLVLGRAGWEARFVVAALAERGWVVDARYAVAPRTDVRRGLEGPRMSIPAQPGPRITAPTPLVPGLGRGATAVSTPTTAPPPAAAAGGATELPLTIDTTRYAAVLAIDSAAAREAPGLRRYLAMGGGILLWPEAAASALGTLAAGLAGAPPEWVESTGDDPPEPEDLPLGAITALHADAVALERRDGQVAVAARRIGPGRVLQLGIGESWRLRMQGDDSTGGRYREWLAGLVSRVAFAPALSRAAAQGDAAPYAMLVDRLGPPDPEAIPAGGPGTRLPGWSFGVLLALLLAEWGSRRLRGVR